MQIIRKRGNIKKRWWNQFWPQLLHMAGKRKGPLKDGKNGFDHNYCKWQGKEVLLKMVKSVLTITFCVNSLNLRVCWWQWQNTLPASGWLVWLSSEETSSKSYISFSYFDRFSAGALTNGGDVSLLPIRKVVASPSLPEPSSNSGDELLLLCLIHWLARFESEAFV